MEARDVVIKPLVTEKCNGLMAQGKYTFMVNPSADKIQIKNAVEEIFKVKVKSVNTMRVAGKMRRVGKSIGLTSEWKKAVVTLQEGQKIEIFEGM